MSCTCTAQRCSGVHIASLPYAALAAPLRHLAEPREEGRPAGAHARHNHCAGWFAVRTDCQSRHRQLPCRGGTRSCPSTHTPRLGPSTCMPRLARCAALPCASPPPPLYPGRRGLTYCPSLRACPRPRCAASGPSTSATTPSSATPRRGRREGSRRRRRGQRPGRQGPSCGTERRRWRWTAAPAAAAVGAGRGRAPWCPPHLLPPRLQQR